MKLIYPGDKAFSRVLELIEQANAKIDIQMFIWRDDEIGNQLLDALIKAAQKGIQITLRKDLFGSIFEKSEENKQSMFHKPKHFKTALYAYMIDHMYHDKRKPRGYHQKPNPKVGLFLSFPNVKVSSTILKDHTKYYIFDDQILYIGGVNVEDKENGADIQGREYRDYMVELHNETVIQHFKSRLTGLPYDDALKVEFITNAHHKEAKLVLPNLISNAREYIIMHMAYFGAKKANEAILTALKYGVKVDILTSNISNLQNDYNRKLLKEFYQAGASIYLHPGLIHAKALLIDDQIIIGSTNLNRAAFDKLGECSIKIVEPAFKAQFLEADQLLKNEAKRVTHDSELHYHPLTAWFEEIAS
jgi:cardiolipin synthase